MPKSSGSWVGAEAIWITAAGLATAAEKIVGKALVFTNDKISEPTEVYDFPIIKSRSRDFNLMSRLIPSFFKVFIHDIIDWRKSQEWGILKKYAFEKEDIAFVLEKHDLFKGVGKRLANRLGVPFISYVHSPVIWEASKWGVKRYAWGKFLAYNEAKNLKKADLVAVVSEEVKIQVMKMGVPETKIIISPMAVDQSLFQKYKSQRIIKKYQLQDQFIIGWTGSFRNFHGLDHLIKAFETILGRFPNTKMVLVGDGAEKENCERLCEELGITDNIIFTGRKKFAEIPELISVFDVAVVSARSADGFHYSPLKLREYMAAEKPVLAPDAGEIPEKFKNGDEVKLFEAGNIERIVKGLDFLIRNPEERKRIAKNGYNKITHNATWEVEIRKILDGIEELGKR
ncbi:MAG: glycosyltransferase family 4 protein [Bacteroidota bacterium]